MTYTTKQGEMWDEIAYKVLGGEKYLVELVQANRQFVSTLTFKAGVELTIPTLTKTEKVNAPPWRQ